MEDGDRMDETSDNDQQEDIGDSIINDSTDLDWALITYALNSNRLIFIGNHKNWSGFHSASRENGYKYLDYTPEQLSARFLEQVLPRIDDYELTDHEEYLLNLLKLHPNFRRSEKGFVLVKQTESCNLQQNGDSMRRLLVESSTDAINIDVSSIDSGNQLVVAPIELQVSYNKFKFLEVDAALLSLCLSANEDLPNCEVLPITEIHKRMKDAKHQFECTGHQPENINISVEELTEKLKMLVELKCAIVELINNRFGS